MIRFLLGVIFYTAGVIVALSYSGKLENQDAQNFIYGGLVGIGLGLILTIWGYLVATSPKKA